MRITVCTGLRAARLHACGRSVQPVLHRRRRRRCVAASMCCACTLGSTIKLHDCLWVRRRESYRLEQLSIHTLHHGRDRPLHAASAAWRGMHLPAAADDAAPLVPFCPPATAGCAYTAAACRRCCCRSCTPLPHRGKRPPHQTSAGATRAARRTACGSLDVCIIDAMIYMWAALPATWQTQLAGRATV